MTNSSWSFSKVALSVTKLTDLNKFLNALTYAQFVSCQNKNSKSKSTKIIGQPAHQSRLEIMIMLKQA